MARSLISLTPWKNRAAGDLFTLALNAEVEHTQRLTEYRKYWRFYKGKHWDWERGDDDPVVTINHCRNFVDEHGQFTFGKGFKVKIPDDPATPAKEDEDREFVRLALEENWRRNNQRLFCIEMGQMGSVTGDVFLRTSWEESDGDKEPYVRVDVLPSRFVFPSLGGPFGVDGKKMESCMVVFPRFDSGEEIMYGIKSLTRSQRKRVKVYIEHWFKDRVLIYDGTEQAEIRPNPLGEIPIIHIPNYPTAGEFYGRSDLVDLTTMNQEFNEKCTDISDTINYQGSPVTVVKGARLKDLERGANRIWGIPPEAEVKNLELGTSLSASMDYLRMVKTSMHEMSGIPEDLKTTTATSGVALAMKYYPMLGRRNVKLLTYGPGLEDVNRLVLKILSLKDNEFGSKTSKLKGDKYRNEVVFPNPLPRDEAVELDKSGKRLELGLSTVRRELEREGLSQAEIEKILTDKQEEKLEQADIEFKVGQKFMTPEDLYKERQTNRSGNPDPDRSNPDIRGENRSSSATPQISN